MVWGPLDHSCKNGNKRRDVLVANCPAKIWAWIAHWHCFHVKKPKVTADIFTKWYTAKPAKLY